MHSDSDIRSLRTLEAQREIAEAQRYLAESMKNRCTRSEEIQLGFQGGGLPAEVHWNSRLDIWMAFHRVKKRFWSAFGTGNPFRGGLKSIVVEINFPFEGTNRLVGGVFCCGDDKRVFLGHRGRVGGGRPGIGQKAFLEYIGLENIVEIRDGNRRSRIIFLGPIDSQEIEDRIAAFVRSVARFKEGTIAR